MDADPQANSTSGLGINPKDVETGLYECMISGEDASAAIVTNDQIKYLDVLPSNIDLVGAEVEMVNIESREEKMRDALLKIKDRYDFIIIDCSPSLGLITINALTAADSVIIPVQCEYFALEGLGKLLNTIKIMTIRENNKRRRFIIPDTNNADNAVKLNNRSIFFINFWPILKSYLKKNKFMFKLGMEHH